MTLPSQGRGYNYAYIMTVEDAVKNPWSQKKEIVNVAVSRAKEKICVITSSSWMSKEMQKELLGYGFPKIFGESHKQQLICHEKIELLFGKVV